MAYSLGIAESIASGAFGLSQITVKNAQGLKVAGCFAGVGGIELGLRRAGHAAVILSELDPIAQVVLKSHFPDIPVMGDIRNIKRLPECDLISAGFPCQDLSQCGKTAGLAGKESSLINEVFRLIDKSKRKPNWVLLENVPFMLCLDSGRAMRLISGELGRRGYRWAYRTVNARSFGVPQRRLRVVFLASLSADPREVLFADDASEPAECQSATAYGFYWTEGNAGLGWASNCVPTLKSGSTIGIPSPPAIWIPSERRIATIDIRDAERLQGFPVNWTKPAMKQSRRPGIRWRFVGNAVCVRVASWVGRRLSLPGKCVCQEADALKTGRRWPSAAFGDENGAREIVASTWPVVQPQPLLLDFLRFPLWPLSVRATAGFLGRARRSKLRFDARFLDDVEHYLASAKALTVNDS